MTTEAEVASTCKAAVVALPRDTALVCLILNCIPFTSGIGTMVSACTGDKFNMTALLFGILQFLLMFILVGWIWSIVHGIQILDKSKK